MFGVARTAEKCGTLCGDSPKCGVQRCSKIRLPINKEHNWLPYSTLHLRAPVLDCAVWCSTAKKLNTF